jgi:hypothetical protein
MGRIMEQAIGLIVGGAEGAGHAQDPSRTIAASERALKGAIVAADGISTGGKSVEHFED